MYGMIAQKQNGALAMLEHRYFGDSNPYPYLNATSFEVLTIPQAIDDLVYFAKNADLPMTGGDNVEPGSTTPWIIAGSSYSGTKFISFTTLAFKSHLNYFSNIKFC